MPNSNYNNLISKENLAKVEIVQELKDEYKIPSFEEFMKTYESDSDLNYDELTFSDITDKGKGYGSTTTQRLSVQCGDGTFFYVNTHFYIILEAEWGVDGQWFFGIPTYCSPKRFIDWHNNRAKDFLDSITKGSYNMNGIWQDRYMRWRILLEEPREAEELLRHFASGGLSVRGRGSQHHTGAESILINTVRTALETNRNGGKVNVWRDF